MARCRQKTIIRIEFGKRVRELRHELGFSIVDVGKKSNLHPTYISSVERGERNISLEAIYKLASGLGCPPSCLLPI